MPAPSRHRTKVEHACPCVKTNAPIPYKAYDVGMSSSPDQIAQPTLQTLTPFPAVSGSSVGFCAEGVCVVPTAQDPATDNDTDDSVTGPRRRRTATID